MLHLRDSILRILLRLRDCGVSLLLRCRDSRMRLGLQSCRIIAHGLLGLGVSLMCRRCDRLLSLALHILGIVPRLALDSAVELLRLPFHLRHLLLGAADGLSCFCMSGSNQADRFRRIGASGHVHVPHVDVNLHGHSLRRVMFGGLADVAPCIL